MTRGLLVVLASASLATAAPPPPGEYATAMTAAAAGVPGLALRTVSHSPEGRPIQLLLASSRPERLESQIRVLVIAGQHGDEASPGNSVLLWLRSLAGSGAWPAVAVFVIPSLNPDGAARGRRANAAGVDLNRDWAALSQPETRLVADLVRRWRIHLVFDLHAFDGVVGGRRRHPDWVERYATGRPAIDEPLRQLQAVLVARHRALGEPVIPLTTGPGSAQTLCHRAFAARGVPALLVEVGDGRSDPGARLLVALLDELQTRHAALRARWDPLRGAAGWRAPRDFAPPPAAPAAAAAPPRPVRPPLPLPWPLALAAWTGLLVTGAGLCPAPLAEPRSRRCRD
ncbi:MAG: DUF2817 domain-containing protein [Fimbriimonadaceae bacterium]|nr:DUF2817 domain-containing protein [Fimbriimonadaceae bacterium]